MKQRSLERFILRFIILVFLLGSLLPARYPVQAGAIGLSLITISPTSTHPDSVVVVNAYRLTPFTTYKIGIIGALGFIPASLKTAIADANGQIFTRIPVPVGLRPGTHTVAVGISDANIARQASLTVLSAPTLLVSPTTGKPGDLVQVTVNGLEAGELQISFGQKIVIGPLKVFQSSYSGSFRVPWDSAAVGSVTVQFINLVNGKKVASASTSFTLQMGTRPAAPVFSNLVITPAQLLPGQAFTITGKVTPVPSGLITTGSNIPLAPGSNNSSFSVHMEDDVTHESVLVEGALQSMNADGGFIYAGTAPDARLGHSMSMRQAMHAQLELQDRSLSSQASVKVEGPFNFDLQVETTDVNGNPIGNITVIIDDVTPDKTLVNYSDVFDLANYNLVDVICHMADNKGALTIPGSGRGEFHGSLDDFLVNPLEEMLLGAYLEQPQVVTDKPLSSGSPMNGPSYLWSPPAAEYFQWRMYEVYAEGRPEWSYYVEGDLWAPGKLIKVYKKYVWYHLTDGMMLDTNGDELPEGLNTSSRLIKLKFEHIPPTDWAKQVSVNDPTFFAGKITDEATGYSIYSGFMNLPKDPAKYYWKDVPAEMMFSFTETLGTPLESVTLYIEGQAPYTWGFNTGGGPVDPGPNLVGEAPTCEGMGGQSTNDVTQQPQPADSTVAPTDLTLIYPFPTSLPGNGVKELRFEFHLLNSNVKFNKYLGLKIDSTPQWFLDLQSSSLKQITYIQSEHAWQFSAQALSSSVNQWGEDVSGEVPNVGHVSNSASANMVMIQKYVPITSDQLEFQGLPMSAGTSGVDAPGLRAMQTAAMTDLPTDVHFNSNELIQDGETRLTFSKNDIQLAYIALPVYVTAFEDPLGGAIISGTAGMVVESTATANVDGWIDIDSFGLAVSPHVDVSSVIWLDVNLLYGILAQASLKFMPKASMDAIITFNNSLKPELSNACLGFRQDMSFYFGYVCAPILGCLKEHEGTIPIYSGTLPDHDDNCVIDGYFPAAPITSVVSALKPNTVDMQLTSTGYGSTVAIYQLENGHYALQEYKDGAWGQVSEMPLTNSSSARIAYLSEDQAIVVWTKSDLTQAAAEALEPGQVAHSQYMQWALRTGNSQTSPANLSDPNAGDGQVSLGACPAFASACPENGAVTAAWQHMKTSDPYLGGYQVLYRTYINGAWSAPAAIPAPADASDAQSQVFYRGSQAYIAFIRDADGSGKTTDDRKLYFYKPGDAAAQLAGSSLPGGIVEFSVAVNETNEPRIIFTAVDAAGVGLFDNRHPLYSAKASCSGAACTWEHFKLKDPHGRAIFAEGPVLSMKPGGEGVITYRGLGMGPDSTGNWKPYPEDSIGIVAQTGELAQLALTFDDQMRLPNYLTGDGAINWHVQGAYDKATGTMLSLAVSTPAFARSPLHADESSAQPEVQALAANVPLVFAATTDRPNFMLDSASASQVYFTSSSPLPVTVSLHNDGSAWTGSPSAPVVVSAAWDAPYGEGILAGQAVLTALGAGQATQLQIDVTPPATPDIPHTLYLSISAPPEALETSDADNHAALEMGGLPAAEDLMAMFNRDTKAIYLNWVLPQDPRITSVKIYRAEGSGPFSLLGITSDSNWLDLSTQYGKNYHYAITLLSSSGSESPLSEIATINTIYSKLYLPITKR